MDSSVKESMQGVVDFKPYIPASEELDNFTSRWRTFLAQEPDMDAAELGAFGVWAYDIAWRLMEAAERTRIKVPLARKPDNRLNLMDLDKISTLIRASILVEEILRSRFKGLSGEFHFSNGKLISNMLEIIKIGRAESRIGFWTSEGKITGELHPSYYRRHLSSVTKDLEAVIWPRGSTTIPRGRVMQMTSKTLRIGVVQNSGFPELVHVYHDLQTNTTTFTGFSIEVFKAAIESLPYAVRYEFIPIEPYRDPVDQVYLQKYDAAVGDITITANRSIYVDFTLPYTDLGVGMVSRKDNKNLWIFLQPLTADLWLTSAGFFILTGFVVWLIERPINQEFQGSLSQQIGMIFWFSFSTLVFAHRERLESNLSRFVVLVWVFVVLVLTSSYTATLTSMMTIQQIQLNSNENNYIGYQHGSFAPEVLSNLNFKDSNLRPLDSPNDYANALSKGSKNGGVSAIIDEIPYIKIFLGRFSADYAMIGPVTATTNGFGFVFPKGSPLVPDISRQIARLREKGKLLMFENLWFRSQLPFTPGDSPNPLTVERFRGLFLISGTTSALALAIFSILMLHENWHFVKNCYLCLVIRGRGRLESIENYLTKVLKSMKKYLSTKNSNRTEGTNAQHPDNLVDSGI